MKRKRNRRIFGCTLEIHVPTGKLVSRKQIAIVSKSMSVNDQTITVVYHILSHTPPKHRQHSPHPNQLGSTNVRGEYSHSYEAA